MERCGICLGVGIPLWCAREVVEACPLVGDEVFVVHQGVGTLGIAREHFRGPDWEGQPRCLQQTRARHTLQTSFLQLTHRRDGRTLKGCFSFLEYIFWPVLREPSTFGAHFPPTSSLCMRQKASKKNS